jgi:hypothetical protein
MLRKGTRCNTFGRDELFLWPLLLGQSCVQALEPDSTLQFPLGPEEANCYSPLVETAALTAHSKVALSRFCFLKDALIVDKPNGGFCALTHLLRSCDNDELARGEPEPANVCSASSKSHPLLLLVIYGKSELSTATRVLS